MKIASAFLAFLAATAVHAAPIASVSDSKKLEASTSEC